MLFFEKDFLSKARECLRMFIEDYDESSNPTVKSHKKIFLQAFKSKYVANSVLQPARGLFDTCYPKMPACSKAITTAAPSRPPLNQF